MKDVKSVALDVSSKTSVALTKIIFREFFEREPHWKPAEPDLNEMLSDSDCALLIGDPALMIDETKYKKFDLAETWKSLRVSDLFLRCGWRTRKKRKLPEKIDLTAARDEGLRHLDEIISNYESEISLAREDFKKYLSENISYSIDDRDAKRLGALF